MKHDKARKIAARQRAAATGQSYTAALRQITTKPGAELGTVGQRVRVRQGVAYDYLVTVTDYSGVTGIVRHVADAERGRFCYVEPEDGKAYLVLPVFHVDDLEAAPVVWVNDYGEQHELLPVGTRVQYSGEVLVYVAERPTSYAGAFGWIIAHNLTDEPTPYHVRADADGADFLARPDEIVPAPWMCSGDLVNTPIGNGRVQDVDGAVTVRLNAERIPGETHRRWEPEDLHTLHHVDEAGNLVPAHYIRQVRHGGQGYQFGRSLPSWYGSAE